MSSRLGSKDEERHSKEDEEENPSNNPNIFGFMNGVLTKKSKSLLNEVETYLGKNTNPFDENPLKYRKNRSADLPTLAKLAKEYLRLTATSTVYTRGVQMISAMIHHNQT